jgi:hypothetical protein
MNHDQPLEPLEFLREQRLDLVGLIWMVSTVAVVGTQIYGAVNFFGSRFPGFGTWERIAALAQTGGPVVALSCVAGVALAALFDTTAARVAMVLAVVVGAWVLAAGVLDVVSAVHGASKFSFALTSRNRVVDAVGGLGLAGFGLVVVLIASAGLTRRTARRFVSPPESTLR